MKIILGGTMYLYKFLFMIILFFCFVLNCSDNNSLNADSKEINIQVDLQSGFSNQLVYIKFDETIHFKSMISEYVPFSGPESFFLTNLPDGDYNLSVVIVDINNSGNLSEHTQHISFEPDKDYFIGLLFIQDSLIINVQNSPFGYL
jgi:hypothetical protein